MRQLKQKPFLMTVRAFMIVCGIIAIIGFFLIGGAMGACDNGAMSIGRAIMYIVIGMVMCVGGALGVGWFSNFEDDEDDDNGGN